MDCNHTLAVLSGPTQLTIENSFPAFSSLSCICIRRLHIYGLWASSGNNRFRCNSLWLYSDAPPSWYWPLSLVHKEKIFGGLQKQVPEIRLSCADASLRDAHLPITPHGPWPKQIIYIMAQVWKAGRQSHWTDIIGCLIIYVVTRTCIDTLKHSDLLWHIVASCVCGDSSDFLFLTLSLSVVINLLFLTLSHSNNFPFICSS